MAISDDSKQNLPAKHPGGRPTKYTPDMPNRAKQLSLLGLDDEKIAIAFGVDVRTIYDWKNVYPEFSQALKEGKANADAHIAESLYHRAKGYVAPEEKVFLHQGEVIVHRGQKYHAPDTTAAIFWLKNRHPELWRDVQEVAQKTDHTIKIVWQDPAAIDVTPEQVEGPDDAA